MADIDGIDEHAVTEWFGEHVDGAAAPLEFSLIAGGHSNLTYAVTPAGASAPRWVLRRPPLGQVLATAHDVEREHTIISALEPTDVPVPVAKGLCTDPSINDAPFYVMDFVQGSIIRTPAEAEALPHPARRRAGESMVDVLAAIHAVDVDAVGLGDLGRREGYVARQLKRWYTQFQGSEDQVPGGLGLPQVHDLHDQLAASIPTQQGASIVHGDYRLDNTMLSADGSVAAVLDWEICALGDPLADVGLLCVYWSDPDDTHVMPQAASTTLDGFPRKDELMRRYAATSGRDMSDLGFYIAFGYWKLTCIIAGVYARYAGGAMGDVPSEQVEGFRAMLDALASLASGAATGIDATEPTR